jgi:hypothetical protein
MAYPAPEKAIREIIARLARLEKSVLGRADGKKKNKAEMANYSGPTGGVRFLISKGLFKKKAGLAEVRAALAERDYHYSKQAVHESLKRLSGKGGPLVALKEGGKKYYVRRK